MLATNVYLDPVLMESPVNCVQCRAFAFFCPQLSEMLQETFPDFPSACRLGDDDCLGELFLLQHDEKEDFSLGFS